ncbi:MAG: PqiC family protein [Rhodanobacter sp.]
MIRTGLIRTGKRLLGVGALLALAACASTPLHYYTLIAPAGSMAPSGESAGASGSSRSPLPFELLPVSVPAQVDQPQLVVREGGQGVALLNGERWIAPLGDEVRGALSADLARELRSQDVSGLPANDKPLLRIKLDLRRFDSQPGSYALIEGNWSVRLLHGGGYAGALACSSRISETVGPGYDALVQGHQRAIEQLAGQIAAVATALGNGQTAACPAP